MNEPSAVAPTLRVRITWYIWLPFATPKFLPSAKTSDIPETLYELVPPPKKEYLKIQGELV
ncbi:hypothetical protein C5S32_02795 [ANME-1 cluster archaeon GoMg1]|nr:hypothetical protein [ANME-1 cluster archaeon GoMg1]